MNQQTKKKPKKKSGGLWTLLILLALAIMAVSGFQLGKSLLEYRKGTEEYDTLAEEAKKEAEAPAQEAEEEDQMPPFQEIDFALLQEQNPDTVGWIEFPGTRIDYPVMRNDDVGYYLTHTFSRAENIAGSIFMESANHGDFQDAHTIIYGHNMKNGSMFGLLKKYREQEYFQEHPYFYLYTPEATYVYDIFSCYEVSQDSDIYTAWYGADETFAAFVETLKKNSAYDTGVEVTAEDSIITLSTCVGVETNRYVIHAKRR